MRPTDYRVEFCETAFAMAQQGATDREIAEALDVHEATLYRWRNQFPEFRKSLALGKEAADERVENSLYRRAVGYSFDAVKIMQDKGNVIVEPYVEHVPPDIGAIKFWLTNRRGEQWRDKQSTELTGKDGGPVKLEKVERVIIEPQAHNA